jgi:signal transduction histidine kinase
MGLTLALFCLLGAGGVLLYSLTAGVLLAEFDAALKARALALASTVEQNEGEIHCTQRDELGPESGAKPADSYFQIWRADGAVVQRSPALGGEDLPCRLGSTRAPGICDITLPGGRHGRAIGFRFVPQLEEDEGPSLSVASVPVEALLVLVAEREGLDSTLALIRAVMLLVGAVVLVGSVFAVRVVIKRGLAPLGTVARRAAAIDAESLETRFPVDSMPAELQPICERLNDLLSRLQQSFERERCFSADAAHELRTPIAELRSLAEVALKWQEDAQATRVALQDALDIARQMEGIVTTLLAIARCESGGQGTARESVAVAELIESVWQPLAHQAQRKKLSLTMEIAPGLHVETDRAMFRVIVANLLSNAVEYSPVAGLVAIGAILSDDEFALSVSNTCTRLTESDLPWLFRRFWRKDAARSGSDHSGLGLALAKAFSETLGMVISAELAVPGTLTIIVRGQRGSLTAPRNQGKTEHSLAIQI